MSSNDKMIVLDTPEAIEAFGYLQIYNKLKMEVKHAGSGMRWRHSPMKQAQAVLARAGIKPAGRKASVLAQFEQYLKDAKVLR